MRQRKRDGQHLESTADKIKRSDDWSLENVPLGVHEEELTEKLDRQQQRKLTEALRKQDVERILFEADALRATIPVEEN